MPDPLLSLSIAAVITALGMFIFWPERGVFWRWQRAGQRNARIFREDALKHIHQCEIHNDKPSVKSLAGALDISANQVADVVEDLQSHELLQIDGTDFRLTPAGRDYALRIIRAHRLYERYLAEETGFEEAEWHAKAQQFEHRLSPEEIDALSQRLGNPTYDPHGDPIPTADGVLVYPQERIPLASLALNTPGRIVHLEDEPEMVYAQLIAQGLHIGQEVRLLDVSPQRVLFWAGDDEHVLAPILAANIAVIPVAEVPKQVELPGESLTNLKPGQTAQVLGLSPRIRGAERRRLMDLGLLPGTTIEVEMASAGGDPIAYRIRGAVIALRKSQAQLISVCPEGGEC
jgi:DtxR family Mn-dependent transcriptional regulator